MTPLNNFKDAAAERTLIATILRHGKDSLLDAQTYVTSNDFSLPVNRTIFTCLSALADDPVCENFDTDLIQLKAKAMGLSDSLTGKKEQEYLDLLTESSSSTDNIPVFGMQIKKYSVIRDLYKRYQDAQKYLTSVTGDESLSEIIRNAESTILNYIDGSEKDSSLEDLCNNVIDEIQYKLENDPVDQIGIPTGFPKYDSLIGGGLRNSAIDVIASRSKVGKGWMAMNIARNIAKLGIPTLYIDTEMTKEIQLNRLISIDSGCPIEQYETGKFKFDNKLKQMVLESGQNLTKIPIKYESVAGMSHTESLTLARRWLAKTVGFNDQGKANPCVLVYDYIKLASQAALANNITETMLLGFLMCDLSAFAVKYNIPVIAFAQTNRDGIDSDNDASIIACSDRILWLCSSLSSLRNKTEEEQDLNCGFEYGNKKLKVLETRHGAGHKFNGDWINIFASIRPNVDIQDGTGKFTEGHLYSEIVGR